MDQGVKYVLSIGALVGAIASGLWAADSRYALSAATERQINDVKVLYLHSERRALERQKFELQNMAEKRKLTDLEQARYREIESDLRAILVEIKRLGGRQ